jgi:hypothetical protein
MFILMRHTITDARKWDEVSGEIGTLVEHGQLPKGLKALFYLPSTDGRNADCVWEADSLNDLKSFLDPKIASAARNEYYQINVEHSFGLPVHTPERVAAR